MKASSFSKKIILWYHENKRVLPWRTTTDPYKIWLSEIILQQTRVAQGLPYYLQFVETFPTVQHLAQAPEQKVLRLWQGLGYYTRARNLHRCAKEIVETYHGQFPITFQALQKLPGIGQYTAAAIASFAFREAVAVTDGNVFRVLSRVFGWHQDIASPEGRRYFFEQANKLIPADAPDIFNQAMMEFGAIHCTPKNPNCSDCIFSKNCVANQTNLQHVLPVKSKKTKISKRYFYYLLIGQGKKLAMVERVEKDIWKGLYDFPLIETLKKQKPHNVLTSDERFKNFVVDESFGPVKHILSHQHLFISFVRVQPRTKNAGQGMKKQRPLAFYSPKQMSGLPKPIVITRFLQEQGLLR